MKLIFCLQISTKAFYKLVVSLCVYVARHAQNTQNTQSASLQYLFNISRRTLRMKLIFCLQINVKCFLKMILSFQVCVGRYTQIIKNNKLAISLQYFKKEVSDEIFCMQTSMKACYKLILRICWGWPSIPKVAKSVFTISEKRSQKWSSFVTCR